MDGVSGAADAIAMNGKLGELKRVHSVRRVYASGWPALHEFPTLERTHVFAA
jgi:hypothetical protein